MMLKTFKAFSQLMMAKKTQRIMIPILPHEDLNSSSAALQAWDALWKILPPSSTQCRL